MSTRGVKYQFSIGEHVLCFEPDPTKARVLYEAKVLDLNPGKDKAGRRKPEYHIHFQGWNNSWDRIVGEDFILKSSDENKLLMRRLAETARKYATNYSRKNRVRKRKINAILRRAFVKKPKFDSGSETSSSGSDNGSSTGEEDDEEDDEEEVTGTGEESENGPGAYLQNGAEQESNESDVDEGKDDYSDDGEVSIKGKYSHVEIPIPKTLKEKLEEDYEYINRTGKLVKLPAEPNIVTVLEGYVKNFVMNCLFSTTEKLRPGLREFTRPEPEKSVPLCKEVMQGIRVCFDFTLPMLLLYNAEREQHEYAISHHKPPSPVNGPPLIKKEVPLDSPSPEAPQSPTVLSPSRRRASSRLHSSSGGESSPKIPKLSPKVPKEDECESEDPPPRRLTRQSTHVHVPEVSKRTQEAAPTQKSRPTSQTNRRSSRSDKPSVPVEPKITRSTRRTSSVTSPIPTDKPVEVTDNIPEPQSGTSKYFLEHCLPKQLSGLSQRVTPPPPLLLPSAISSKGSSPRLTPTTQLNSNQAASDRETALNEVLSWKMLSPDLEKMPLPCLIYGTHHLLRLFVKLPELVGRMRLGEHKQKALLKHFELFLEYLATRHEEMLPDSVYIDGDEEVSVGS